METITLNNGVKMPQLGYGVYQVEPAEAERCVSDALSVGYRMVDTAQAYRNEEGVGAAVKKSGLKRDEVFIVSKVWISNYGYERAQASIDDSLKCLQTEQFPAEPLHRPRQQRGGSAGRKSSGDTRLLSADPRQEVHGRVRHQDHVMGPTG